MTWWGDMDLSTAVSMALCGCWNRSKLASYKGRHTPVYPPKSVLANSLKKHLPFLNSSKSGQTPSTGYWHNILWGCPVDSLRVAVCGARTQHLVSLHEHPQPFIPVPQRVLLHEGAQIREALRVVGR